MADSEQVESNHIPAVRRAIHDGLVLAIREATKRVSADSAGWCPIDTGFLKQSHYWVTSDNSTYNQAVGKAHGTDAFRAVFPEVDHPESDTEGIAAVAASYAPYVEYGTGRMAAQPFLHPAAEAMRGHLPEIVGRALKHAIEDALKK